MDTAQNHKNNEGAVKGSFVFLFVILIATDQASKYLAKDIFQNHNFAFSLPVSAYLMYLVYFIGIASIAAYLFKQHQNLPKANFFAWLVILAGAGSNVGERVVLGYVRDWIYIGNGVFNFADGYIIAGLLILILRDTNIRMHANDTNNTNSI